MYGALVSIGGLLLCGYVFGRMHSEWGKTTTVYLSYTCEVCHKHMQHVITIPKSTDQYWDTVDLCPECNIKVSWEG
jgi:acetone carboxylase gamma subunit